MYVSADQNAFDLVKVNRPDIGEWEVFTFELVAKNKIALLASNNNYIGFENEKTARLVARDFKLTEANHFSMIKADSLHYLLKNANGRFVQLDTDGCLLLTDENIELATKFKLKPIVEKTKRFLLDHQIVLLSFGFFGVLLSILLFQFVENKLYAVLLLMIGGLLLRLFMVELVHHLHFWDEQYHALVAKNMITQPFRPMLFPNPIGWYDQTSWIAGHVWLHKQPLFLWQMALSMKVFGVNTLALRLPSALMHSLVILFIYRIGKIGFSQHIGYFGALLFALSNFAIQIAGGAINTDHNDAAFLFYVAASIWAWFEYERVSDCRKLYLALIIGLFSGCAILVKWLPGLLVYAGWAISIIYRKEKRASVIPYFHLFLGLLVTVAIFLPWQLYIFQEFPVVAKHEYDQASEHFFNSIEGHGEGFNFHFLVMKNIYGIAWPWVLCCIALFIATVKNSVYKVVLLTYLFVIYLFFSIAVTKMVAFTFCVSFLMYIILGNVVELFFKTLVLNDTLIKRKANQVIYVTLVLAAIGYANLNLDGLLDTYTMRSEKGKLLNANRNYKTKLFKRLPDILLNEEKSIVYNCHFEDPVQIMFFTNVLDAHTNIPSESEYNLLKNQGYDIVVFDNGQLPTYLMQDPRVLKLKEGYHIN